MRRPARILALGLAVGVLGPLLLLAGLGLGGAAARRGGGPAAADPPRPPPSALPAPTLCCQISAPSLSGSIAHAAPDF